MTQFEKVPDVHKIAVLRANGLGDVIFLFPALDALHAAYPEAEIILLGKSSHAELLKNRPRPVQRVVVIPPYGGVSGPPDCQTDPAMLEQFFAAMKKEHFDLAFQVHGGGHYSNPFVHQLGSRMTIGLKTEDAASLDRWLPYIYFQPEILRYLEVVSLAGVQPTVLEPHLEVTPEDLHEAQRVIDTAWPPQTLVALHPGATDPRRRWPPEQFATVGDALVAAGAQVIVTGVPEEQELVEAVVHTMKEPARNLCGRVSPGGLAGLFSACRVVVSNDTGPLHLARAVGTPTVGIYWCFNLINGGPITRARHRTATSWRLTCPVCGTNCLTSSCTHQESFVADVPLEDVLEPALDLLRNQYANGLA